MRGSRFTVDDVISVLRQSDNSIEAAADQLRIRVELVEAAVCYWGDLLDQSGHLESRPDVKGGAVVIRDTRITSSTVLARIEAGDSLGDVIADYPYVKPEALVTAICGSSSTRARRRHDLRGQLARELDGTSSRFVASVG